MPLKIIDPATGEKIGSTRLARQVLAAAIDELDANRFATSRTGTRIFRLFIAD
jgi:hypothetical protein